MRSSWTTSLRKLAVGCPANALVKEETEDPLAASGQRVFLEKMATEVILVTKVDLAIVVLLV